MTSPAAQSPRPHAATVVGVALLNLSGLGLGYLVLKRVLRFLVFLGGTVLIINLALWVGSPHEQWGLLLVLWIGIAVVDGVRLAAKSHHQATYAVAAVVAGGLICVALGVGYWLYRTSGDDAYAAARALHLADNCHKAEPKYADVARVYRLTFAAYARKADANREECADLIAADRAAAAPAREFAGPLGAYLEFLDRFPDTPLRAKVRLRAAGVLIHSAVLEVTDHDYLAAVARLDRVLTDFGDTQAAGDARQRISGVWRRLRAEPRPCMRFQSLDEFRDQRDVLDSPPARLVQARATRLLPASMLACASKAYKRRNYALAIKTYRRFLLDYPTSPKMRAAEAGLIRARVSLDFSMAGTRTLPAPPATGSANAGTAFVSITNGAAQGLELLFSGQSDARSIRIAACALCPPFQVREQGSCPDRAPSKSIAVVPGSYRVSVRAYTKKSVRPFVGTWDLQSGYRYAECYFIVTTR